MLFVCVAAAVRNLISCRGVIMRGGEKRMFIENDHEKRIKELETKVAALEAQFKSDNDGSWTEKLKKHEEDFMDFIHQMGKSSQSTQSNNEQ